MNAAAYCVWSEDAYSIRIGEEAFPSREAESYGVGGQLPVGFLQHFRGPTALNHAF